jgi:hypothetical protein
VIGGFSGRAQLHEVVSWFDSSKKQANIEDTNKNKKTPWL